MLNSCNFCENTIVAGTFRIFTTYRCEDRDYDILREDSGRVIGYFEKVRYCPACLRKFCLGEK